MLSNVFNSALSAGCPFCPDPIDVHDRVRAFRGEVGHLHCTRALEGLDAALEVVEADVVTEEWNAVLPAEWQL